MEIAVMWKAKVIIVLIVSTTANAATNSDDLSLEICFDGRASVPGVPSAQGVGDLGRDIELTIVQEGFFLASRINGAVPENSASSYVTTQERLAVVS
jgi:hypothetical protein